MQNDIRPTPQWVCVHRFLSFVFSSHDKAIMQHDIISAAPCPYIAPDIAFACCQCTLPSTFLPNNFPEFSVVGGIEPLQHLPCRRFQSCQTSSAATPMRRGRVICKTHEHWCAVAILLNCIMVTWILCEVNRPSLIIYMPESSLWNLENHCC